MFNFLVPQPLGHSGVNIHFLNNGCVAFTYHNLGGMQYDEFDNGKLAIISPDQIILIDNRTRKEYNYSLAYPYKDDDLLFQWIKSYHLGEEYAA